MATTNVKLIVSSTTSFSALVSSPLAAARPTPVRGRVQRDVWLAPGVGPGLIDTLLLASGTLTAGASTTVNLFDGSTLTVAGLPGSLALLKHVEVGLTTPGTLVVGGGSHALGFRTAADTLQIEWGGAQFASGTAAGWPVTALLATVLLANPGTGPVAWQLVAAGSKAPGTLAFNRASNSMYVPLLN